MAWYTTGTVYITNGSTTLNGTGTDFITAAKPGYAILAPDERLYEIASITSATVIVLRDAYLGSTVSSPGSAYKIIPFQGLTASLVADVQTLISDFSSVRDNAGIGLFDAGTVSAPGIRWDSDINSGLYSAGADIVGIAAGGLQAASFTTTGATLLASGAAVLTATTAGIAVTGNATFADNGKATFGTGNDLEIYHDGTDSIINDAGVGNLKLKVGGTEVVGLAAAGIDVTGSVTPTTGIYLGGAAAGNLLDDYEEGNWTPTLIGVTSGAATVTTITRATYTKIGDVVHAFCYITVDLSAHTIVGGVQVGGLPFTTTEKNNQIAQVTYCDFFTTDEQAETISPRVFDDNAILMRGSSAVQYTDAELTALVSSTIMLGITYKAA